MPNSNEDKRMFKKSDIVLIGTVVLLAIVIFVCFSVFNSKSYEKVFANIYINGEFFEKYDLNNTQNKDIKVKDNVILEIENRKIRFKSSPCQDKICQNFGLIGKHGETAVCMPEGVVIKIEGYNSEGLNSNENKIDAII